MFKEGKWGKSQGDLLAVEGAKLSCGTKAPTKQTRARSRKRGTFHGMSRDGEGGGNLLNLKKSFLTDGEKNRGKGS